MDLINRDRIYNELLNRFLCRSTSTPKEREIRGMCPGKEQCSVPSRLCALYPIILGPTVSAQGGGQSGDNSVKGHSLDSRLIYNITL